MGAPTKWENNLTSNAGGRTRGNEPGKLVEKSTIDQKKIKKVYIKNILGQSKQLLIFIDNANMYIIEDLSLLNEENDFLGNSNWEFSKTAYENKYKGIQLELSGRLRGAQRARKMVKKVGSLSKQSFSSKLNFSKRNIYTKWGILGLKVYLNK